jgi:transcription factor SPN1
MSESPAASDDREDINPPVDRAEIDDDDDLSGNESELSEVDEAEFADFDPTTVALEDRPLVGIDEDVARTLKASKRKRTEDGKKPKEGKREKRKRRRDEDEDVDAEQLEGKRVRKPKSVRAEGEREKKTVRAPSPENEENLTPEERRKRALDRAMDAALKNPNKRRRKKDEVVGLPSNNTHNGSNDAIGS